MNTLFKPARDIPMICDVNIPHVHFHMVYFLTFWILFWKRLSIIFVSICLVCVTSGSNVINAISASVYFVILFLFDGIILYSQKGMFMSHWLHCTKDTLMNNTIWFWVTECAGFPLCLMMTYCYIIKMSDSFNGTWLL